MKSVAVIGAGASGLAALKSCLEEGLNPTCFEKAESLGGLWNYSSDIIDGRGSVMKSTITNTSKEMMCFSDFPAPKEFPIFLTHEKMIQYFSLYVNHFKLEKHIQFNKEIISMETTCEGTNQSQWRLIVNDVASGKTETMIFDAVMLCCGHHAEKIIPSFPGITKFEGEIVHSHDYRESTGFENKRVVVVGLGNSGGDIASELALCSSQVYLSSRSGAWMLSRLGESGLPYDMFLRRRSLYARCRWFPKSGDAMLKRMVNDRLDHCAYSIEPNRPPFTRVETINDELPNRIASGRVIIKANIKSVGPKSVTFTDGTKLDDIDVLIFATGFELKFPPFLSEDIKRLSGGKMQFYKYMVPANIRSSNLFYIGYVDATGPQMPMFEMQCRFSARVIKGSIQLPSTDEMWRDINSKLEARKQIHKEPKEQYITVEYNGYLDELAAHIGCSPNIGKLLFSDPLLAMKCYFGPLTPCQFRIRGTGKWSGARDAIMHSWDRTLFPLKSRPLSNDSPCNSSILPGAMVVAATLSVCLYVMDKNGKISNAVLENSAWAFDKMMSAVRTQSLN